MRPEVQQRTVQYRALFLFDTEIGQEVGWFFVWENDTIDLIIKPMILKLAQQVVTRDLEINLQKIITVLSAAQANEWVIFPEGMLSGYFPQEPGFISGLNMALIQDSIQQIEKIVAEKKCYCLFGTAYEEDGRWYNATVFLGEGQKIFYYKNNLATLDRECFIQGNELEVYKAGGVIFGVQMCRELVFPEQWKLLKYKGAQIIFHLNNSIKFEDKVRQHLVYARAFENQYFVCSVNNADKPQTMNSLVVSPMGDVLLEFEPQVEKTAIADIDLQQVKSVYIEQERRDLVRLAF